MQCTRVSAQTSREFKMYPNAAWSICVEQYYAVPVKVGFYVPRPRMAAAE
jgi:hypothetical protein